MAVIKEVFELVDRFSAGYRNLINMSSKASNSIDAMGKATQSMTGAASQRISALTQSLDAQVRETRRLQKEYSVLSRQAGTSQKALTKLRNQISQSQKQEYSYSMAIAKTRQELQKASVQEELNRAAILKKEAALKKAEESLKRTQKASESESSVNKMWNSLRNAAVITGGIKLTKDIMAAADQQSALNARIDMMNDGLQTTEELQKRIYQAAQASRGSYNNTAGMVGKFGTLAPDAFNSSQEIVDFAEQINKHLTLSGASGAGADAAVLQLTQALSAGVLRGEELNSVLEQAPTIAQTIAEYMGVNIGKMRELASEGKITSDVVKNALFSAAEETNAKFAEIHMTFAQLWQSGMNAVQQASMPALQAIAKGATFIHDNWDKVAPVLLGVAAAAGMVAIALGAQAAAAWIAKAANDGLRASLLANPLTWVALGIGVVVALIYRWIQAVGGMTVAWLIFKNYILTVWDEIELSYMAGYFAVQGWMTNMYVKMYTIGANIGDAMGDMKVNVLTHIEGMVNGAINLLNSFINAVNAIPGVAIGAISQVSFAASASAKNEASKAARASNVAALNAAAEKDAAQRERYLNSLERQAERNRMERLAGIASAKAASDAAGTPSGTGSEGIPGYSGKGAGNIGKVGSVGNVKNVEGEISLADEDLKLYRDLAERRYMNRVELKTMAPNINVTLPAGASGQMKPQEVADYIKKMLIEQMNSHTAISHT